jgi:hypothetical protein
VHFDPTIGLDPFAIYAPEMDLLRSVEIDHQKLEPHDKSTPTPKQKCSHLSDFARINNIDASRASRVTWGFVDTIVVNPWR